jgi:hypothetical protein
MLKKIMPKKSMREKKNRQVSKAIKQWVLRCPPEKIIIYIEKEG